MFYLAGEALAASVLLKCMLKPPQLILYLLFSKSPVSGYLLAVMRLSVNPTPA
jgi:hypothetical protein